MGTESYIKDQRLVVAEVFLAFLAVVQVDQQRVKVVLEFEALLFFQALLPGPWLPILPRRSVRGGHAAGTAALLAPRVVVGGDRVAFRRVVRVIVFEFLFDRAVVGVVGLKVGIGRVTLRVTPHGLSSRIPCVPHMRVEIRFLVLLPDLVQILLRVELVRIILKRFFHSLASRLLLRDTHYPKL